MPFEPTANDAPYDLIVVGGGVQGAWVALEAARSGLRVALIEKGDFGSGTSANSLKVLHGGLRYLQHGNLKRIRESRRSIRSARVVAGDWIEEVPFVLGTRGHGVRGPWLMSGAFFLYRLLGWIWRDGGRSTGGRVFHGGLAKKLSGRGFSPASNGFARWHEAVMSNSERVVFEVIRAAEREGAHCRNYCEMTRAERDSGNWKVRVTDRRSGEKGVIIARQCIEATGPSIEPLLQDRGLGLLRGVNLVFQGTPFGEEAIGLESREDANDPDALIKKGNRLLFFVPHGDQTMVGTWYDRVKEASPEVSDAEIAGWLAEIEAVAPGRGFTRRNLRYLHRGLLPADARLNAAAQPAKESEIFDIGKGRLAIRTVKYTTAPEVAREALKRLGVQLAPRLTFSKRRPKPAPPFPWDSLLRNDSECAPEVLQAGIQEEKVAHLDDALVRRSNVVLDDFYTGEQLHRAACRMGKVMEWDEERCRQEVKRVLSYLREDPSLRQQLEAAKR